MPYLLTTLVAMLPLAANAEPIPKAALEQSFGECVSRCEEAHSYGFCADMCGCMTGEMSRHWEMEDYRARSERLRANPEDPDVGEEMTRLASYCAGQAR